MFSQNKHDFGGSNKLLAANDRTKDHTSKLGNNPTHTCQLDVRKFQQLQSLL